MHIRQLDITITTDGSGDAEAYVGPFNGIIRDIIYTKDDYANGVDFAVTTETTERTVWQQDNVNADDHVRPVEQPQTTLGADVVWYVPIHVADERLKIVIAQGGATKSGTFSVIVEGH